MVLKTLSWVKVQNVQCTQRALYILKSDQMKITLMKFIDNTLMPPQCHRNDTPAEWRSSWHNPNFDHLQMLFFCFKNQRHDYDWAKGFQLLASTLIATLLSQAAKINISNWYYQFNLPETSRLKTARVLCIQIAAPNDRHKNRHKPLCRQCKAVLSQITWFWKKNIKKQ